MSNVEYEREKSWTALLWVTKVVTRKLEVWGSLGVPLGSGKLGTRIEHPSEMPRGI